MSSLKLVSISDGYMDKRTVLQRLWLNRQAQLACRRRIEEYALTLGALMSFLDDDACVVFLNARTSLGTYSTLMLRRLLFPFCILRKNQRDPYVTTPAQALKKGNYFVCCDRDMVIEHFPENHPKAVNLDGQYPYHVPIEATKMWRNKPPYVNLDRDEESLGYSSWNGNLVSWLDSSFGTRIQFGVHTGILNDV